jgi:hypothetical protein
MKRIRRDERGAVSAWTILMASGVFLILLGLVYDGGNVIDARLEAHRAAEQAARGGADEMAGLRDGHETVNVLAARSRANEILADAGWQGSVRIRGRDVSVRVRDRSPNVFLNVIGFKSFPVDVTGTATSITGPD